MGYKCHRPTSYLYFGIGISSVPIGIELLNKVHVSLRRMQKQEGYV